MTGAKRTLDSCDARQEGESGRRDNEAIQLHGPMATALGNLPYRLTLSTARLRLFRACMACREGAWKRATTAWLSRSAHTHTHIHKRSDRGNNCSAEGILMKSTLLLTMPSLSHGYRPTLQAKHCAVTRLVFYNVPLHSSPLCSGHLLDDVRIRFPLSGKLTSV